MSEIYHVNVADYHHCHYSGVSFVATQVYLYKGTCTVGSPVTNAGHV